MGYSPWGRNESDTSEHACCFSRHGTRQSPREIQRGRKLGAASSSQSSSGHMHAQLGLQKG